MGEKAVVHPRGMSAEFVWRMEDVLDLYEEPYEELYEEPYDSKRPVVCFDEMPYQMVAEKRVPIPAKNQELSRTLRP